jgi:hypothetical protein
MDGDVARIERALRQAAGDRVLAERIDRLEIEVARVSAHLDGASVTLVPSAEALRPPVGPDPALELQRIVNGRVDPPDPVR